MTEQRCADAAELGTVPRGSHMHGERLRVPERMVVAPAVGVFCPTEVETGTEIEAGAVLGIVHGPGTEYPVCSPFGGTLMGMLAHDGERLREGQPVAWLRVA
jgi:biotin carboxyl carrier protein